MTQDADRLERRAEIAEAAEGFLTRLVERAGATTGAESVFAPPVERDGVSVIPVARVRWGGGRGSDGFGGGLTASPVGYIEVRDGVPRFHELCARRKTTAVAAVSAIAAVAVDRVVARRR